MAGLVPAIHVFELRLFEVVDAGHKAGCDGRGLMPEMPRAGEHHGDAMVVGGFDHLVVAH